MDREPFLAEIAARLGRARPKELPPRDFRGLVRADLSGAELAPRFASELSSVGGEVVLAR